MYAQVPKVFSGSNEMHGNVLCEKLNTSGFKLLTKCVVYVFVVLDNLDILEAG